MISLVEFLLAAAAFDAVEGYYAGVAADRAYDCGEWSDAARGEPPAWLDAAFIVAEMGNVVEIDPCGGWPVPEGGR